MVQFIRRLLSARTSQDARRGLPRMPASVEEAESVHRRWDRLNGRYYFVADVRFEHDPTLRRVVFDSDRNIAVEADGGGPVQSDRIGSRIDEIHIQERRAGHPTTCVPCPTCGGLSTPDEFLARARGYWADVDVTLSSCPRCGESLETQIEPERIHLGYTYAAGAPHFSRVLTVTVPGLQRRIGSEGLVVELGDRSWSINRLS